MGGGPTRVIEQLLGRVVAEAHGFGAERLEELEFVELTVEHNQRQLTAVLLVSVESAPDQARLALALHPDNQGTGDRALGTAVRPPTAVTQDSSERLELAAAADEARCEHAHAGT